MLFVHDFETQVLDAIEEGDWETASSIFESVRFDKDQLKYILDEVVGTDEDISEIVHDGVLEALEGQGLNLDKIEAEAVEIGGPMDLLEFLGWDDGSED